MPAGATYTTLATATVGTAGTSFLVMSSIPATYTDLVLVINGSSAADLQIRMRLNNVSTTSYSSTVIGGNGSSASSARTTQSEPSVTALPLDYFFSLTSTSGAGTIIVNLMNYSNTTTKKTILSRANNAEKGTSALVGLFDSTNAINQIDIVSVGSTNIAVGTTFSLYGIAAA